MFNFKAFMQPYMDADSAIGGGSEDFSDVSLTDSGDSFDEVTETETTDSTNEAEDTTEAEKVTEVDFNQFLDEIGKKAKFNHEPKRPESIDEVVTNYQKGMAFDKLQEKFEAIQNNPALAKYGKVEEISKLLGYQTDDELLDALYQTHYERTAETQGLTPAQIRKEHELAQKERALVEKETSTAQQQQQNKMYADFATNFPDVKADAIKQETWDKVNSGMDLSTAYTQQQNQDLINELKVYKQNAKNSERAPVGGVSKHGSDMPKADKVFEGFDD